MKQLGKCSFLGKIKRDYWGNHAENIIGYIVDFCFMLP